MLDIHRIRSNRLRTITTLIILSILTALIFSVFPSLVSRGQIGRIAHAQGIPDKAPNTAGSTQPGPVGQAEVTPVPSQKMIYLPSIPRNYPWSNPFGLELNRFFGGDNGLKSQMASLGANWVRLNNRINWKDLQPVEGGPIAWDTLAMVEAELLFLKEQGMTPVMLVDDYPHWATAGARKDGVPTSCGRIIPSKLPVFAAFMEQIVRRYSAPEFNVHHWELSNEPDVDPNVIPVDYAYGCWGDAADLNYYGGRQYGEMLKVVTPAIRRADPNATVWIGGLLLPTTNTTVPGEGKPENFFKGIMASGAAPYFDIVSFHWYPSFYQVRTDYDNASGSNWDPVGGGVTGKATYLRNIMVQYGVDKPLFLNETALGCPNDYWNSLAWCVNPDQSFYEAQADFLVRTFTRGIGAGVDGFLWYTLEGPGWRSTGLLDANNGQKQVYLAYQQLISQLEFSDYAGPAAVGTGLEGYTFKKGEPLVQVVWAKSNTTLNVTVPQSKLIAAYNLYGGPVYYTGSGSDFLIPVGFSPVYILRRP